MRATFHQTDETKLRVGTVAPTCAGAPEGFIVDLLIGHIHGAAVQTYHAPSAVPGALRRGHRDGLDQFIVELAQRLPAQARSPSVSD